MANKRYIYLIDKLRDLGVSDGEVVDSGCGEGAGSKYLIDSGFNVYSFDASSEVINKCEEIGVNAKIGDITNFLLPDNFADIFICSETLEHLTRDQSLMASEEIQRVCKEGGVICITVPEDKNKCMLGKGHKQYLSSSDIVFHFSSLEILFEGVYCKKKGKCNRVMFFRNKNE